MFGKRATTSRKLETVTRALLPLRCCNRDCPRPIALACSPGRGLRVVWLTEKPNSSG